MLTFDFDAVEVYVDAMFAAFLRGKGHVTDSIAQVDDGVWHWTAAEDYVQHHFPPACTRYVACERERFTWHCSR